MKSNKHIVVLGGGFAGVEASIALSKKGHKVTLISNRNYLFVYPISIWIPTNRLLFEKATLGLEALALKHGFSFIADAFTGLDTLSNKLYLKKGEITYDYLILATGAEKMKHAGIENTLSICGEPEQSIKIKDRFDTIVESGGVIAVGFGGNPKDMSSVRGGPAFELLFNLKHELKRRKSTQKVEFAFFSPMPEPGRRMGEKGYKMLLKMLAKHNISRHVGKKIRQFESDAILFEDDSRLKSDLTLFIPASNGPSYLAETGLPLNEAGFISVDEQCKVKNRSNIYAIGDIAAIEGPEWRAKQGHIAVVMAKTAAYNIHNEITGNLKRKKYVSKVNIICVMDTGNGAAIVYRKGNRDAVIPLPVVGHWLKKAWAVFYKFTKK